MSAARIVDTSNPNYKNAGWHVCETCRQTYHSYIKTRKYCSQRCYGLSPANLAKALEASHVPKKKAPLPMCGGCGTLPVKAYGFKHCGNVECAAAVRKPRRKWAKLPEPNKTCNHCGKAYHSYNKIRRYCSYDCHLLSGGAWRAGIASSEAKMRYGAKKDANHKEIFDVLHKLCPAYDCSDMGNGFPDGVAWIKGSWHLFDVKNPKTAYGKRGLNSVQLGFIRQWQGGPVYLIYTIDEAIQFARGNFSGLKCERSAAAA